MPDTRASSIRRPDTPRMSLATQSSLMPVSSSALCRRLASRCLSPTRFARDCRFRDCSHVDEPGCAVVAAVDTGALRRDRLDSFHKLTREAQVVAAKADARLRADEERKWKTISKASKEYLKRYGHR